MKTILSLLALFLSIALYSQSFTEKEVQVDELRGTLSIPDKKTNTAVLLISGSGPTDRNGNSALGLNNNSLKMVAQELTEGGYAVLRYDKRGIAESKTAVADPTSIRFNDFIDDAKSWIDLLSNEGYTEIVIAGHSQGSLVGMLAAQDNENVKGFVSLAGLAEDAGNAIVRQLGAQSPMLAEDAKINIDSIKAGYTVNQFNPYLISIFGPAIQPFLKSYIAYAPAQEITKLDIPVLIINGTTDLQIDIDQAYQLKEAFPDGELLIIQGMNHVLKDAPADDLAANAATYNNPDLPLSEGLISGILKFIEKL
ncbi:alpha/beta hydrolase [Ekhidna sp. To15]|uniref:alpha/beta hydrolase n=1 Tax=Ekhidna sp. To15 TaxID=3395267 RepID=UPI003F5226A0